MDDMNDIIDELDYSKLEEELERVDEEIFELEQKRDELEEEMDTVERGLDALMDRVRDADIISYADIPGFPALS